VNLATLRGETRSSLAGDIYIIYAVCWPHLSVQGCSFYFFSANDFRLHGRYFTELSRSPSKFRPPNSPVFVEFAFNIKMITAGQLSDINRGNKRKKGENRTYKQKIIRNSEKTLERGYPTCLEVFATSRE